MPVLRCPIDSCDWKSQDLDEAFAVALTTALQIHYRTVHKPVAQPATHKLKFDPPTIAAGCDPDQWLAFTRQWKMYKTEMAITDNEIPTLLFYCCDPKLRKDIMHDLQGNVVSMIETDVLNAIKRLAVKEESTLAQRIKLNKMTQLPGSNIRNFLASLRRQASLCKYKATCKEVGCNHIFDYSDEIIKDILVRGIADPEIMSELLGDSKTDRTLEETVWFIAQKEQDKLTSSTVGYSASAMSAICNNPKQPDAVEAKYGVNGQRNDCMATYRYHTERKYVPEIKLQGEIQHVKDANVKIQEIFPNERNRYHSFDDKSSEVSRPKRGTLEHLHYMVSNEEHKPPAYWKKFKSFETKVTTKRQSFFSDKENILEPISSSSSLYKCIEDLVQKTWRADKCGQGQDAVNLHHKNIRVTSIERIENIDLYYEYAARRRELFSKALKMKSSFTNIGNIPNSRGPMLTTKLAGKELTEDIFPEINEHYAFHGTSKVEGIAEHGLDYFRSGEKNLLGSAVYMSESSTKADQYADPKHARTPGPKKMILGRILLGNTYLCLGKNPPKYKKPPCTDLQHLDQYCEQGHDFFDSVMADGHWLFREFAVYDNTSVYPEYIITYNRI